MIEIQIPPVDHEAVFREAMIVFGLAQEAYERLFKALDAGRDCNDLKAEVLQLTGEHARLALLHRALRVK